MSSDIINGSQTHDYDRTVDLKAFDERKTGVKGLIDEGVGKLPRIFVRPQEDQAKEFEVSHEDLAVPVIDLAPIFQGNGDKDDIVREISSAAGKWGFFQLVNHGIPLEILESMIEGVRRFHEQDEDVKKEFYTRDRSRPVRYDSNYDLYRSKVANWRDTLQISNVFVPELKPEVLPSVCRDEILAYMSHVEKLGDLVLELLSLGLGLKSEYLKEAESTKAWTTVGHYYPGCPEPDLTLGASNHTDPTFITVLLQDHIGGLQVLQQNKWVNVKPIPGALVVNIGDILQMISNDKYESVYHRVIANKVGPRISIATFLTAPLMSPRIFGPVKEMVSEENPAKYKEFTIREYLTHFYSRPLDERGTNSFRRTE